MLKNDKALSAPHNSCYGKSVKRYRKLLLLQKGELKIHVKVLTSSLFHFWCHFILILLHVLFRPRLATFFLFRPKHCCLYRIVQRLRFLDPDFFFFLFSAPTPILKLANSFQLKASRVHFFKYLFFLIPTFLFSLRGFFSISFENIFHGKFLISSTKFCLKIPL